MLVKELPGGLLLSFDGNCRMSRKKSKRRMSKRKKKTKKAEKGRKKWGEQDNSEK